jgi:putative transposase
MHLNDLGQIAAIAWGVILDPVTHLTADEWVVMPNHFHALLVPAKPTNLPSEIGIVAWRAARGASARIVGCDTRPHGPASRSLGAIVGAFKSATAREINRLRGTPGAPVWQRGYYEHVIADDASLTRARQYIADNPRNWAG